MKDLLIEATEAILDSLELPDDHWDTVTTWILENHPDQVRDINFLITQYKKENPQ
jgi:hypothetical protein